MTGIKPNWNACRIGLLLSIFLALHGLCQARPFQEYYRDIDRSRTELRPYADESVNLGEKPMANAARDVLVGIRNRFPEREEIDLNEESVPVDNRWLAKAVEGFETERRPGKKLRTLLAIQERLDAIYFHISRLRNLERRGTTKDYEKRRLDEILAREEYSIAEAGEEGPAARLYKYLAEWLRSLFPEFSPLANQPGADLRYLQGGLQVVVLLIAAALVAYVIARFGPQVVRRYGTDGKTQRRQLILGEEIAADATTDDLFGEAERLASNGDIRGAVRKGYISLLFELGQRRLIGLAKHKTNRDYLRDIRSDNPLRSNVRALTRKYESIWYGNRNARDDEWDSFKESYRDTLTGTGG